MAIFSLDNIRSRNKLCSSRYLNEIQVNGEDITDDDNFTMDDEETTENENPETETPANDEKAKEDTPS